MADTNDPPPILDYARPTKTRSEHVGTIVGLAVALVLVLPYFLDGPSSSLVPAPIGIMIGILAVTAAVAALACASRKRTSMALSLLGLILGLVVMAAFLAPSLSRPYTAIRVKCGSNLHALGEALAQYAKDHRGQYPARWEDLLLTQQIDTEVFCCPASDATPARGTTPQERAANLTRATKDGPKHLSYVYLGGHLTTVPATPETVLAHEPLANHGDAIWVLFGDGNIEFIGKAQAQSLLAELTAGHNPPRPNTSAAPPR